jgi:heme exporter protein A
VSALLKLSSVACVRGGRLLFEGLDLELGPGEALHVTGPNGSGKSSLIRLIAGLLRPAAGRVERAERIALADEHLALDRELPLGRALAFWNAGARPTQAMDAMGLADLDVVPVRLLSTGQARRARLARVIASAAPLWLLDEPLNGLDADGTGRLTQAFRSHRAAGGAVLAASHQPLGDGWRQLELGQ